MLGLALVLVYISYIIDFVETSTIRLFADDTLISRNIERYRDCVCFQNDLNGLNKWSLQNSMRFNATRSNTIISGPNARDTAVQKLPCKWGILGYNNESKILGCLY